MPNLRIGIKIIAALMGLAMLLFALLVSNESYAAALLNGRGKDLSWGPSLFRALLVFHGCLLIALGLWRRDFGSDEEDRPDLFEGRQAAGPSAIAAMVALSFLALALRLWRLNSDLWIDEVLTLLDFVRKPIGEILVSFPSQNQHMLFSILAHVSTNIFGESAWSLRLPAVVFGVGGIWAFFFLCKSLLGPREALLGSALMTVSYHHIWFSQNARGYTGLLLFAILATWYWLEALKTNQWRWWAGYVVSIVLGMWVHPTMAFVVAAQALLHLVLLISPPLGGDADQGISLERRAGVRPFAAWLLSVTVTLQLYALALHEFIAVGLHEESHDSEWTNPIWVVTETLKGLSIGFAGIAVVVFGGALVAFGWYTLFRKDRRAAVLMVLPALLAGGSMLLLGHNLWPRFFFFSMGFGLLLVIQGATRLPVAVADYVDLLEERAPLTRAAGLGFVGLLIVVSLFTLPKNYALPKQNFSGAKSFVESRISPGDGLVAVSLAGIVYGNYLTPHWATVGTRPELENYQLENNRLWLVYTIPIEIKAARPELWQMIQNDFEVVKVFPGTLNGGEVFVCQKKTK